MEERYLFGHPGRRSRYLLVRCLLVSLCSRSGSTPPTTTGKRFTSSQMTSGCTPVMQPVTTMIRPRPRTMPSLSRSSATGLTVCLPVQTRRGKLTPLLEKTYTIPADKAIKWIRPQAFFPNCWNGKDSYLPGNGHVSYPTGDNAESGPCPTGYKRIPSLFMESECASLRMWILLITQRTTSSPRVLVPSTNSIQVALSCECLHAHSSDPAYTQC